MRERLNHGDIAGALAVVEGLLGPDARLRAGALRDELETAARREIVYRRFRAGLPQAVVPQAVAPGRPRPRSDRGHPRHAMSR